MARIGDYVNFNPKITRPSTGEYFEKPTDQVRVTMGPLTKRS